MKKFRIILALVLLSVTFVGSIFASEGGKDTVTGTNENHLRREIVNLIELSSNDRSPSLDGEAVITFKVDQENQIQVNGVFGTNEDLIEHINESLEGAKVNTGEGISGKVYKIRVKFQDFR